MKNTTIKEDWADVKGKIKAQFSKLTDESIDSVKGNIELLSGKLQHAYGYAKEHADKELAGFKATLHSATAPDKKTEAGHQKSGHC